MEEEQTEAKIPLPEAIFVGLFVAAADALEVVLVFFLLDDFWISDAIAFPATQIYFRMRGVKGTASLVTNVLELFPYVGSLPLRTIGFVLTVWVANHPESAGALTAVAAGRSAALKGGVKATQPASQGPRGTATPTAPEKERVPAGAPQKPSPQPVTPQTTTGLQEPPERGPEISEEAFGVEKEPVEKVKELMEKVAGPENH